MEQQDAYILGKNPQSNVSDYGVTGYNTCDSRESNDFDARTCFVDFGIEVRTYDFGYSDLTKQADNRQTTGATATKLDTQQNQAKSNYV